ncbi:hypothetical protein [Paracidovorax citrulli]|uniref:hypothetical protein n=1 Tax=Paracidovorax citrulli TaxID=80869 RepID=UPI00126A07FB|nr:hypothetical protein [Paracidovorax citrulli]
MRAAKLLTILTILWSGGVHAHACLDWGKSVEKINSTGNSYSALGLTSKSDENFLIKKEGDTFYHIEGEKTELTTLKEAKIKLKLLFLEFYFPITNDDCLEIGKEIEKSPDPATIIRISHPTTGVLISELLINKNIKARVVVSCFCTLLYRQSKPK